MTVTVNIHEAKTHLSRLLMRVQAGEEVIIAHAGKPVARLVSVKQTGKRRKPGSAAGLFTVPQNFNDPLSEDVLRDFGV
jgi:prevent-host-death family protein